MKGRSVGRKAEPPITFGVNRDEKRLNFLGIRPEIVHNLGYVRKRRRADIGAVCAAAEDEKELTASVKTGVKAGLVSATPSPWVAHFVPAKMIIAAMAATHNPS